MGLGRYGGPPVVGGEGLACACCDHIVSGFRSVKYCLMPQCSYLQQGLNNVSRKQMPTRHVMCDVLAFLFGCAARVITGGTCTPYSRPMNVAPNQRRWNRITSASVVLSAPVYVCPPCLSWVGGRMEKGRRRRVPAVRSKFVTCTNREKIRGLLPIRTSGYNMARKEISPPRCGMVVVSASYLPVWWW